MVLFGWYFLCMYHHRCSNGSVIIWLYKPLSYNYIFPLYVPATAFVWSSVPHSTAFHWSNHSIICPIISPITYHIIHPCVHIYIYTYKHTYIVCICVHIYIIIYICVCVLFIYIYVCMYIYMCVCIHSVPPLLAKSSDFKSPGIGVEDPETLVLRPAVEGTLNVLRSCAPVAGDPPWFFRGADDRIYPLVNIQKAIENGHL